MLILVFHRIDRSTLSAENTRRKLVSQEGLKRHPDLACIVEAFRTRCTAMEDRSGIDPATQSKELQTFHAKINSVSVTERNKHKSTRDKIWTCAFQPNPSCWHLLAAF